MPRYYFHIRGHDHVISDDEGMDCPGDDAARAEALQSAGEIVRARMNQGDGNDGDVIEIRNARGEIIGIVKLSDALQ